MSTYRFGTALAAVLLLFTACAGETESTTTTTPTTSEPQVTTTTEAPGTTQTTLGEQSPIRIGVLHVATGPLAGTGIPTTAGVQLYFDQQGYEIGGREIELIVEDTQGDPGVGLTKAMKLVEEDEVHLIIGPQSSAVAPVVVPYLASKGVPTIIDQAGTTSLTQEDGSPYVFRTSYTNPQQHLPMGAYAYGELGYREVGIVALGYAAGDEMAVAFREKFEEEGGSVIYESYVPLGTTDMASFITEASSKAGDVDGLAVILFGPPAIQWVNQAVEFGLQEQVPYFCLGCTLDGLYLPAEGENALGVISYQNWSADADFDANREFQEAYEAFTGEPANVAAVAGYQGAQAVGEALMAINGNVEDTESFLDALGAVEFDGPAGPFRFDNDQNAVITVFVMRTEMVDGEIRNVVIDSIPNVDQYYGG